LIRWKEKWDNSRQSPLYQSDSEILKMFWHFHSNFSPISTALALWPIFKIPIKLMVIQVYLNNTGL
jgi:hypothetical protein